jgi:hypothetical protein
MRQVVLEAEGEAPLGKRVVVAPGDEDSRAKSLLSSAALNVYRTMHGLERECQVTTDPRVP